MRKVYLAARYDRRDELKEYRLQLEQLGIEVTSRWLDEKSALNGNMGDESKEFYNETSAIDLEDIDIADTLVFFAENPLEGWKRGGRHVEFGYALAKEKNIVVIGFYENVFHYFGNIPHFKTFNELLQAHLQTVEENSYFGV